MNRLSLRNNQFKFKTLEEYMDILQLGKERLKDVTNMYPTRLDLETLGY